MFVLNVRIGFLRDEVGVREGRGDWGCNTLGDHYRVSHAEWLLQVETLLTVFKMNLMKAFIEPSSLVWAVDSTHSEITHCGLSSSCQRRQLCCSFISTYLTAHSKHQFQAEHLILYAQRQTSLWQLINIGLVELLGKKLLESRNINWSSEFLCHRYIICFVLLNKPAFQNVYESVRCK